MFSSQVALFLGALLIDGACSRSVARRQDGAPTVAVTNGTYYGLYDATHKQDQFLGMPFAQPPVGQLRLANPVSLNTTWEGSTNATEYSPECYGYGSDQWVLGNIVSEDCLTLNVVRPSGIAAGANLPVGVWIHGGGHYEGGSRDPRYNFSEIVQLSTEIGKPFVAVSINYRLQAFGFLFGTAIQNAGVANLGYKDQRLALHWVQENIAAFGGDPAKVTIFGESAGGFSVGGQLVAYGGRDDGLFRGAIQQSGSGPTTTRYLTAAGWDPYYNNIVQATNCSGVNDTLACLRTVPIDRLSAVFNSSVTAAVPGWGPQIDGDFLQASSNTLFSNGQFVKVPLLHGQNADEGTAFGVRGINTTDQFLAAVRQRGADNATATTIATLYPDDPDVGVPSTLVGRPPPSQASLGYQWKRSAAFVGDMVMHAPRRFTSQIWAANNLSAYAYYFDVLVHGLPPTVGSTHFQEVAFVFDNTGGRGYMNAVAQNPFQDEPQSYFDLARIMSSLWISFIVDGDPNSAGGKLSPLPPFFPSSSFAAPIS